MIKKAWYRTQELMGVAGLPSTTQGINRRAKRENWKARRRTGVQGRGVEYALESLPSEVIKTLTLGETSAGYAYQRQDPLLVWVESFQRLTNTEQEYVTHFLLREGINGLLRCMEAQSSVTPRMHSDSTETE